MSPKPPEKSTPTPSPDHPPSRRTSELLPISMYQSEKDREAQRGFIMKTLEGLWGKQLSPGEILQLVADNLPQLRRGPEGEQSRYQEVQNAYMFLEYLQTIVTGQVRYVVAERMTASILGLFGWIGDMAQNTEVYNRNKRRWWGKTVNRPDRNEIQMVKDVSLNSSHGSYVELYDLTDSAYRMVNDENVNPTGKNQFVTAMAFEHLRMFTVDRRERVDQVPQGEEITLPFAGIKRKESYTVVIHKGRWAKKISVPGDYVHGKPPKYSRFHELLAREIAQPIDKQTGAFVWVDTLTPQAQSVIQGEFAKGQAGTENVKAAQKHKDVKVGFTKQGPTYEMLTAADLSITLQTESEMHLDHLQTDYRTNTYGVRIPLTLSFGFDTESNITRYATQHAHAYTDGAYADTETKEVANRAFDRIAEVGRVPWTEPISGPGIALRYSEDSRRVWETRINREKYDDRIAQIRQSISDRDRMMTLGMRDERLRRLLNTNTIQQIATGFSIQNLLTISTMIVFDHDHSHFLEAVRDPTALPDASILAPAVGGITESMKQLKKSEMGLDQGGTIYDILTTLNALNTSRGLTQDSRGPAHIFDTILANKPVKDSMQSAGGLMDTKKTEMLTKSTMFSMLVGGKNARQSNNDYLNLRGFTTAFADTYPDEVFGACDSISPDTLHTDHPINEIVLSVRRKRSVHGQSEGLVNPAQISQVEAVMDKILVLVEQYLQSVDPKSDTRMRRPPGLDERIKRRANGE